MILIDIYLLLISVIINSSARPESCFNSKTHCPVALSMVVSECCSFLARATSHIYLGIFISI